MAKGWFGPKTIGWGVSPKSWEGWLVTVALVALVAVSARWLGPMISDATGVDRALVTLAIILVWLAVYGVIIRLTYERRP